jgi:hypothetical protein
MYDAESDCIKILEKFYNIIRAEYPKEIEKEILESGDELGQPLEILKEVESFLYQKTRFKNI